MLVTAVAGVTLGDVRVYTSTAIGSAVAAPSAAVIATTEVLTTVTDIWDQATMYGGVAAGQGSIGFATHTVTAPEVTKLNLQVEFPFTPVSVFVTDRSRAHNEVVTIVGNAVSVALTGGGSPNIQAADVLDIVAYGA
jgi:hypothetical protein